MEAGRRRYDPQSDRAWASQVYQNAKILVQQFLSTRQGPTAFRDILEAMRAKYPNLCDDTIVDPSNPRMAYWRHLVATAISALKKAGRVEKARDGWVVKTGKPPDGVPPGPEPPGPKPKPGPDLEDVPLALMERILSLGHRQFENLVGTLLKSLGLADIVVTGRTADNGIDAVCIMPFINTRVAVQAKRYSPQNTVGIEPVQRLIGSVLTEGYDRGLFITTSAFTAGAREAAERAGSKIILVDGRRLVDIMFRNGLGIRKVPVVRTEIDEDFFRMVDR